MDDRHLRYLISRLAHQHPEMRQHLIPLLRKTAGIGETEENGNIRWHRFRPSLQVWDLKNAGKRGKDVDMFSLYDLDFSGADRSAEFLDYEKDLRGMNYGQALLRAQALVAKGIGQLDIRKVKGISVNPAGFKKLKLEALAFQLEADLQGYTVRDKYDRANLPACFNRGKADVGRFYRWVSDNWAALKALTFDELTSRMLDEKFNFHSYCRMD